MRDERVRLGDHVHGFEIRRATNQRKCLTRAVGSHGLDRHCVTQDPRSFAGGAKAKPRRYALLEDFQKQRPFGRRDATNRIVLVVSTAMPMAMSMSVMVGAAEHPHA